MSYPVTPASDSRFPAGTFAPRPRRAPIARMVLAQARIESLLFLRHGEQQLLSLIIPLIILVSLAKFPLGGVTLDDVFPLTLAISAMSAGFTGQAIAVAFDRRYGALKRIGASGVPTWTIIAGKTAGVFGVAVVQTLIMTAVALVLGWRTSPTNYLLMLVFLAIGVACFTALGLLLGGTLSSEIVLALGNLIWFLFGGAASYAVIRAGGDVSLWAEFVPSITLAQGLSQALHGTFSLLHAGILAGWAIVAGVIAAKTFKFTD